MLVAARASRVGAARERVRTPKRATRAAVGHSVERAGNGYPERVRPSASWSLLSNVADAHEWQAERAAERARQMSTARVAGGVERVSGARPRSGATLSPREQSQFERLFGGDLGGVRIHRDARASAMAEALGAEAFTVGRNIYLGQAAPRRGTREADRLLGHELAHVVQQSRLGPALQRKLKFTGAPANVARAIALLNRGLFGHRVVVDKSGNVTISSAPDIGPPTVQQGALASRLTTVINDPADVVMTVSSGSATLGGSYDLGDFDIADLETYGVGGLIHEIEEQYQKQIKGKPYGSETTGAHAESIKAESEVTGATRGPQHVVSSSANADGTLDAVVEIPWTYPDGKVKTMVMKVTKSNIVSVTWK